MSAYAISVDKATNRKRYDSNGGRTVLPESASNKTYMESVVSFVKGLSQAYSNSVPIDEKEAIIWARYFCYAGAYGYEDVSPDDSTFFLVLGYANGVQMWCLSVNGEAQEMFSLRDGPVKTACLLPPPPPSRKSDELQEKRPLLALCLATDSKQIFTRVSIFSLRFGEQLMRLPFDSDVVSLQAGPAALFLVTLKDSIHGFHVTNLKPIFVVKSCYCSIGCTLNPIALGTRWLVYSPSVHVTNLQSQGGVVGEGAQSYVTSVLNAAKTISKGISTVGDTVNWLASKSFTASTGDKTSSMPTSDRGLNTQRPPSSRSNDNDEDSIAAGLVTVLDVEKILKMNEDDSAKGSPLEVDCEPNKQLLVAHFQAHVDQPVTCMRLSSPGNLLATADTLGHAFHVFSIFPHPAGSSSAAVHHLYTLWRGTTPAQVQELCFSWDSRWLIASTLRGTSHIFPVSPYGGTPNVRTHTSSRVVNRTSTFQKSAGLIEMDYYEPHPSPSRRPPAESPALVSKGVLSWQTQRRVTPPRPFTLNPRHSPFPLPVALHAVGHIRLATSPSSSLPGMLPSQNAFSSFSTESTTTPLSSSTDVVIATRFLQPLRSEKTASGCMSAKRLLIVSSSGYLTEYLLEPRPQPDTGKVSDQSPVAMVASERVCWPLQRQATWNTLPLPLSPDSPLLAADSICRVQYDLMRIRLKEKDEIKKKSLLTPSKNFPPLDFSKQRVRNVQPKSLEKPNSQIFAGSRGSGGGGGGKRTKSKGSNHEGNHRPPSSVQIERNGRASEDDLSETSVESNLYESPLDNQTVLPASEEWLAQVEMVTHEGPTRRLWMGPQFHFKRYLSTGNTHILSPISSALISNQHHLPDPHSENGFIHDNARIDNCYNQEELDVNSINIYLNRSDPVPTPAPRLNNYYDDYSISMGHRPLEAIEAGSGKFDQASKMLEVNNDERLIDKLADAMLDFNFMPESDGKFSPSSSPKRKQIHRTKSDVTDFTTLAESFDFNTLDNPTSTK